jgi:hypothetical protein
LTPFWFVILKDKILVLAVLKNDWCTHSHFAAATLTVAIVVRAVSGLEEAGGGRGGSQSIDNLLNFKLLQIASKTRAQWQTKAFELLVLR